MSLKTLLTDMKNEKSDINLRGNPFAPAPPPKSLLGRYRLLGPNSAVKVSPLCLGGMNFGESWKPMMGECTQETAESILDYYYDNGGNFIDTANNYQNEDSEQWIGEWMQKRGNRDQIVLATKFTTSYRAGHGDSENIANTAGNGTKSLYVSFDKSLKKLQTHYIDILWLHWWDFSTSIPELMQSLNTLVTSRQVLYLGVSDTPAWVVAQCNAYARHHDLRPFSVYQGQWSAAQRDFERDIIPMCMSEGMGICPWGVMGQGLLKPTAELEKMQKRDPSLPGRKMMIPDATTIAISTVLEKIAERKGDGVHLTSVAIAYVMQKTPYVFPIVGCRTLGHLKGNIEALGIALSKEEIEEIEGAVDFDIGFPMNMLGKPWASKSFGISRAGTFDFVEPLVAIRPAEGPGTVKLPQKYSRIFEAGSQ